MNRTLAIAILLLVATPSFAEDYSELDRIEVTGSRITYRDLLDTPAISIVKPGDYLLQNLVLVNDTRSEAQRIQELHDTLEALVRQAGKRFQVLHGDTFRVTLDGSNYRVDPVADPQRADTSRLVVTMRAELTGQAGEATAAIRGIADLVKQVRRVGRTEIDLAGETALGMNRPERYRYELIAAIAEDTSRLRTLFGTGCRVELHGLNTRIEWERVSAGELMLYIPYNLTIADCAALPSAD